MLAEEEELSEEQRKIQEESFEKKKLLEELKRIYRCGMGPCQGRTCEKVIKQVIQEFSNNEVDIGSYSYRPPLVPIKFEELANVEANDVT